MTFTIDIIKSMIDKIAEPMLLIDTDGKLLHFNAHAEVFSKELKEGESFF